MSQTIPTPAGSVTNKPHVIIMAAGTGGHVIPGLAVAQEMRSRGWSVSWLGTHTGLENQLVPPSGIDMDRLQFAGLRGKGALGALTGGFRLLSAFWQCFGLMRKRKPHAVVGMGGYVCFPGGWMAALLGKPLALVNADAALLLSNKMLLPVADAICFGFDGATDHAKAVITGNPVRQAVRSLSPPEHRFDRRSGSLRVLVVGGSLGAKVLNDTLPLALATLPVHLRPEVVHQSGQAHGAAVRASYAANGVLATVVPFIDNMAQALERCDVIVCRAGAITVSELCAAGVASVLVPLVISTTSHQRDNARWMAARDAAIHLPQSDLTAESLAALLQSLQRPQLLAMAQRARTLAKPDAAKRVTDLVAELVKAKHGREVHP